VVVGGKEKERLGELYSGSHQVVCRQVLTEQPGDLDEENKTRKKLITSKILTFCEPCGID